jgi:two-component sensor histidine kinase
MWGLSDFASLRIVPPVTPSLRDRVIMAALCLGVATAIRVLVAPALNDTLPFVTYFPAVMLASVWGGAVSGGIVLVATPIIVGFVVGAPVTRYTLDLSALVAFVIAGGLMVWLGAALAHSVRSASHSQQLRDDAEAQLRTLIQELGHRSKNGFAIVTALVDQSARTATSVDDYREKIISRLDAMARSQDLVTQTAGQPVNLAQLLSSVLEPFGGGRVSIADRAARANVSPDIAIGLALVFHELATNAIKYGALSHPAGRIDIAFEHGDGAGDLIWQESGGPPVRPPARHGFGVRLFSTALRGQGGSADVDFRPEGLRCKVSCRLTPALQA